MLTAAITNEREISSSIKDCHVLREETASTLPLSFAGGASGHMSTTLPTGLSEHLQRTGRTLNLAENAIRG